TPSTATNAKTASAEAARKNAKKRPPSSTAGAARAPTMTSSRQAKLAGFAPNSRPGVMPAPIALGPRTMSSRWAARAQGFSRVFSKGQDNLADMLAAFHAGMGGGSLAQRKSRVDHRFDTSGGDQRQHFGF